VLEIEQTNAEHSSELPGFDPEFGTGFKSFFNHTDSGEHVEFAFGHGFVLVFFDFGAIWRDLIKRGLEVV
jgi:hypothetical protein